MLELGIACIYQHSNLVPAMSVLDNLYLGRQPTRGWGLLDRRRQRADAEALLRRYEIDLDLDAKVGELTTVKRKEVEIAKALALDARILLMDEPTAWLSHSEVEQAVPHHPDAESPRRRNRLHLAHPRRGVRDLRHGHDPARRPGRRGLPASPRSPGFSSCANSSARSSRPKRRTGRKRRAILAGLAK